MPWFTDIANESTAVLLGGVSGGLLGAIALAGTWWWDSRRRTASELLKDGFAIHASMEAWVIDSSEISISQILSQRPFVADSKCKLHNVEIRLVLDQSPWNAPTENFFGIIDGKRVWIIRDKLMDGDAYPRTVDVKNLRPFPALMSSRGLHELCCWIERVASLYFWVRLPRSKKKQPIGLFLSRHDVSSLWPLLASIRGEDRMRVLADRLSDDAKAFLEWHRTKYPIRESPPIDMLRSLKKRCSWNSPPM